MFFSEKSFSFQFLPLLTTLHFCKNFAVFVIRMNNFHAFYVVDMKAEICTVRTPGAEKSAKRKRNSHPAPLSRISLNIITGH